MSSMSIYMSRPAESEEGIAWQSVGEAPCLVSYGDDDFAIAPEDGAGRIYVNGMRVIGVHPVVAGDFVRVVGRDGAGQAYRVGERTARIEPGAGRRCEFTRRPITGDALRCPCGGLYKAESAEQIGHCPSCRRPLVAAQKPQLPAEELL